MGTTIRGVIAFSRVRKQQISIEKETDIRQKGPLTKNF